MISTEFTPVRCPSMNRAAAASGLGAVLLDLGRTPEARRYLREGLTQWEAHVPSEPDRIHEVRDMLTRADSMARTAEHDDQPELATESRP